MYVFKRNGQEVAAQEWPVWVQLQENGCYGLCNAADAQGVVLGGVVYSLSNRTPMEGTEEVAAASPGRVKRTVCGARSMAR